MSIGEYKCSRCGQRVTRGTYQCPNCKAILQGVRCSNCSFSGSRDDFKNEICPRCGSLVIVIRARQKPTQECERCGRNYNGFFCKSCGYLNKVNWIAYLLVCIGFIIFGFGVGLIDLGKKLDIYTLIFLLIGAVGCGNLVYVLRIHRDWRARGGVWKTKENASEQTVLPAVSAHQPQPPSALNAYASLLSVIRFKLGKLDSRDAEHTRRLMASYAASWHSTWVEGSLEEIMAVMEDLLLEDEGYAPFNAEFDGMEYPSLLKMRSYFTEKIDRIAATHLLARLENDRYALLIPKDARSPKLKQAVSQMASPAISVPAGQTPPEMDAILGKVRSLALSLPFGAKDEIIPAIAKAWDAQSASIEGNLEDLLPQLGECLAADRDISGYACEMKTGALPSILIVEAQFITPLYGGLFCVQHYLARTGSDEWLLARHS